MLRGRFKTGFECLILFFLLIPAYARAEKIVVVGADAINGEITKATDSTIILAHKVFGELEIPKDQIITITIVHDVLGEIEFAPEQILLPAADKPISTYARAEKIVVVGEDTVNGEITNKTDSSIIMVHKVFGKLEIPKDQIISIKVVHDILGEIEIHPEQILSLASGKPEAEIPEVKMPSGKELPPPQIEDTKAQKISSEQIITTVIPEPEKQKPKEAVAADKQQAREQTEEDEQIWLEPQFDKLNALASRLKKEKWSLALDFSIDTTSGENEEATTRFGAHIKRTLPRERLKLDMSYYYKVSDGDTTDNKFTAGAVQDWLNPGSRWFFFTAGRYDFDEFESWGHRANLQVGPGYNLIKSDDMLLDLRFGAGGRKEWGSINSDLKFEGLAGFDFKWKITEKQTFDTSVWYFPVITETSDYRTRSTLNWRYRLSKELNLSLLLGMLHEYQSIVDPGDENSETRTYIGLQMEF